MAAIILPRRWQQQPTGPVEIDWRNPLTQGMAHCYLGGESYHVNLVTRGQDGTQTGRMDCEARPDGLATAGTGSAYMVDTTNAPQSLPLTIGVMAGGRPNAFGPVMASFTPGSVGSAAAVVATDFIGNAFPRYMIDLDSSKLEISDTDARSSLVNTSRAYVCRSLSSTDHALIVGRRITSSSTTSKNVLVAGARVGLGRIVAHNNSVQTLSSSAWFHVAAMWYRGLSDAEAFEFNDAPFQLFVPRRTVLYFAGGASGTADLDGAATATASAQAGLSVAVPLAGAGVAVASAAGALSVSLPLEAAASATASGNGALSIAVPLNAAAVAVALASADLTTSGSADLAGSASANPDASANLTINVSLAGSAIAQAASSANLTTSGSADLAGNASAATNASASLTHGVPLSGAALTVSSADGSLTHIVPLAASAASASMATGGLDVAVRLNAAALAQALASAGLDVQGYVALAGNASSSANAAATLTLRLNLEAAAIGNAVASGALAGTGALVAWPTYQVRRIARGWRTNPTTRTWRVAA